MANTQSSTSTPPEEAAASMRSWPGAHASSPDLLNVLPDAVLVLDHSWRIISANLEAQRISRITPADFNSKTHWEIYPDTVGGPIETFYRKVMNTRTADHIEFYYETFNVWLDIHAIPVESGIGLYYRDITPRKNAEELRDRSVRLLQQVFEATTDGVFSLSHDWIITFLNRQAIGILGRVDLLGRNIWQEFPHAVNTQFYKSYHETMEKRTPCHFEEFYPAPLNAWFSVQCRPSGDGIVVFFRDITADRAAKQDLLDQEATLTFVKQTARVATWQIDLATGVMTMGGGSFPVFGCPNDEIRTVEDFRKRIHPQDRALVQNANRSAMATNTVTTVDYRVLASDGSILWLEGRGVPVLNENGIATHLRGMTTDITARKQDEERLAASEARYRVLTELNPQALWMGDPDGNITYANQGFLDYIGKTRESIGGLGWLDAFDPVDKDRVVAAWTCSIATGVEYNIEARLVRANDRASRWWSLRGLPVRDHAGSIHYWLGVAVDIHDVKTTAEALRLKQEETERQRAELETVYRTAPVGLGLFDPDEFRYLRLNDRLAEIIGLPMNQILGRTIAEITVPAVSEVFHQVLATQEMQHRLIEGEFPGRPGETHFFNVNYSPVFAPDGTIQAIATATLDITHQKKSELALIQSEKLAAVGRLASSISHEINNPLEAVTNLLFLAAMEPALPPPIKTYLHMAQSELARVSQIVTQTLRFHRQAVRPTSVTPAELVGSVLNLYQGRLSNSGIHVQATYASQTPILCFENDIRQVLNNLLANAIDAMRHGGRLIVRAHDTSLNGCEGVRITIADTGHGMAATTIKRIFEPFYTTKALNGTGLGLWISSGIVEHHAGRLTVRSSEHPRHHGTVFALFLPAAS